MTGSTYSYAELCSYAELGCQPFFSWVYRQAPIAMWGHFIKKVRLEPYHLSGYSSHLRQHAYFTNGALAAYVYALRAFDPSRSQITSVVPLVTCGC
jgi:hypothetical protein